MKKPHSPRTIFLRLAPVARALRASSRVPGCAESSAEVGSSHATSSKWNTVGAWGADMNSVLRSWDVREHAARGAAAELAARGIGERELREPGERLAVPYHGKAGPEQRLALPCPGREVDQLRGPAVRRPRGRAEPHIRGFVSHRDRLARPRPAGVREHEADRAEVDRGAVDP